MKPTQGFNYVLLGALVLLAGCFDQKKQQATMPTPEVSVVTIKSQDVAIVNELPGRVSAFLVAEVRPQVGGIIQERLFTEGNKVKANEPLYQIDPASYQANYDSAAATFAKAEANANRAVLTAKRYKNLIASKAVSQNDADVADAEHKVAMAEVKAAQAALDSARINLDYTKVYAPISGQIGKSAVTVGALVTANQGVPLATIQNLDQIYVDVTESSNRLLQLKRDLEAGSFESSTAKVRLMLDDGTEYSETGTLEFADVTVNESTGTVLLRAVFANPKQDLLPGMFVRAKVDSGVRKNALLVPQQGVTRNARGQASAMVIGAGNKIEVRTLQVERTIGDQWLVTDGIQVGDQVIVAGGNKIMLGVGPGAEVKPVEFDPNAKAPEAAPAQ